ncbi:MAG: ABC transporter ATP-binding protein [Planctomycetota bacterium]|jgi:iron complex transport system ATP-binding protein
MSAVIEVENLGFAYAKKRILENLTFEVESGRFLAIAGPNGAGKTTLLNLLCGLLSPDTGDIRIDTAAIGSYSVRELARKLAVVRQEFVPVFDFTVAETVLMGRTPYIDVFGFEKQVDRELTGEALEVTDTAQFVSRPLGKLSAGERQRVFIARALAQDTSVLLLDEPTSFLDLKHRVGIYDLLKRLQRQKSKTIVVVTHDINLAAQYCDEALLLGADTSCFVGRGGDVFCPERLEQVFGIRISTGAVGDAKFFLPMGEFARGDGPAATPGRG